MKKLLREFWSNRPLIENEFEEARWDDATGETTEVLVEELARRQAASEGLPTPTVRAEAYAYLLDHTRLQINPHTPFALKFDLGVDYSYFAKSDIMYQNMFRVQRKKVLSERFPVDYPRMKTAADAGISPVWTDFWHTVPNWNLLLREGFAGILAMARRSGERLVEEGAPQERIIYISAMITCYEAILRFLHRVYEYSLSFDLPEFSQCIKNLTERAPITTYEVMQFSIFYLYFEEIGCERARTLGDIDRLYLPYIQADVESGRYTEEEIKALFQYYFIHFTASRRFAQQPFTVGGTDRDGNDLSNRLTYEILDIYDEMNIYDPKIHLRYGKNTPDALLSKVLSMMRRGNNSICIMNDEAVYRGYERIGISRDDAQHYVVLGCYEPIIMGLEEAEIATTRMNMAKCIELAMNGGRDMTTDAQIGQECPTEFDSFEAFYEAFIGQVDYFLDFAIEFAQKQGEICTEINPSLIYSSSFEACIERGMDVHEHPLKYNNMSLKCIGLATVVDSLLAIKKYVFDKKMRTFAQLREILKRNWEGEEELRRIILADREKYGNNLPLPDRITCDITRHLGDRYCGMKLRRGGVLRLALDSVHHCISLGKPLAATPDGRLAGTPFSRNMVPNAGMDRGGITAYMQSVLKIKADDFVDATVLDFILHPSAVQGEKGLSDFMSLMKIFFASGGFAAQGNIINREMLTEAQKNPEKYSTLQIRVCGWNEYFVKLGRVKQDMFIAQCGEG